MDATDARILEVLKEHADYTVSHISKKLNLPITTIHNRIKRLKKNGVITHYTVVVNHEILGDQLVAYILLTVDYKMMLDLKSDQHALAHRIKQLPTVESVSVVTGGTDIIVRVRVRNITELDNFILTKLRTIKGIDKTQTLVVLYEE